MEHAVEIIAGGVTYAHLLMLLGIIVIPLLIWGVSIERRFEMMLLNSKEIRETKEKLHEIEKLNNDNYKKLYDIMVQIKLDLKDKKNRE